MLSCRCHDEKYEHEFAIESVCDMSKSDRRCYISIWMLWAAWHRLISTATELRALHAGGIASLQKWHDSLFSNEGGGVRYPVFHGCTDLPHGRALSALSQTGCVCGDMVVKLRTPASAARACVLSVPCAAETTFLDLFVDAYASGHAPPSSTWGLGSTSLLSNRDA